MTNKMLAAAALVMMTATMTAGQAQRREPPTAPAPAETTSTTPAPSAATGATLSAADVAELRSDVTHMQSLIEQMERNLGFVDTMSTPMRHQFELELEMWRVVTGRMERKLRGVEKQNPNRG
jgi:hypothetical protein